MATTNDLFSSLISDIKNYSGEDPLHPWLRGVRKMRESLPPHLLKEKLPRFLQKCAQTFESDRQYRNDSRYLKIWIQLMDFVDDPKGLLRTMEENRIGMKKALFYQAYALYYEKLKKFEEAEKMYHLGVQNLAQPIEELQKAYEKFLDRMAQHNRRKARRDELRAGMITKNTPSNLGNVSGIDGDSCGNMEVTGAAKSRRSSLKQLSVSDLVSSKGSGAVCNNDETVVVKFVDTAIVGKSEPEDALHHGLVDPTINMKDAMNAINSMFREPLDGEPMHRRRINRSPPKVEQKMSNGFEVFVDECLDDGGNQCKEENGLLSGRFNPVKAKTTMENETRKPLQETFKIFVDGDDSSESGEGNDSDSDSDDNLANHGHQIQSSLEGSVSRVGAFVFPTPTDLAHDDDVESSRNMRLREVTVFSRFVGSTISDEPEVENACHHGLVDPTINLKEAMDDINNMFGKPIDFVRTNRPTKQAKLTEKKRDYGGFSILPDDNVEDQQKPRATSSDNGRFSILPDDYNMENQQKPRASSCLSNTLDTGGFSILPDDYNMEDQQKPRGASSCLSNRMDTGGFSILPDDNMEDEQKPLASSCLSKKSGRDNDLFEPTVFTKQAMDDINEMFGKPLDF